MFKKLSKEEKLSIAIFVACFVVYTVVGMGRNNYNAAIAYIVREGIFTKSDSGIISAAFYLFYAIGQFFGGMITEKISPFKTITIGIIGCFVCNLLLCFTQSFVGVLILWSINGLVQFGIWPGIVKIISTAMIPEYRKKASVCMVLGLSLGTVISYTITSLLLDIFGWFGPFLISALSFIPIYILWKKTEGKAEVVDEKRDMEAITYKKSDKGFFVMFMKNGIMLALLIAIITSFFSTGLKTWAPTLIMENYNTSPSFANILTTVMIIAEVLVVFLLSDLVSSVKNVFLVKTILFGVCIVPLIILQFIGTIPLFIVVLMLAIISSFAYIMTPINTRASIDLADYGCTGVIAGIVNSFACLGSMFANSGLGIIVEHFGWSVMMKVLLVMGTVCFLLSFISSLQWRKFLKKEYME